MRKLLVLTADPTLQLLLEEEEEEEQRGGEGGGRGTEGEGGGEFWLLCS